MIFSSLSLVAALALSLCGAYCGAAVPDAARKPSAPPTDGTASTSVGVKKFASASDCSGAVGFSGVALRSGSANVDAATPLGFKTTLSDKGVGWSAQTGEYTCFCPGLYQFAYSGANSARLALKRKTSSGTSWRALVTGPTHVILLDLELGDKVAVFLEGGSLPADTTDEPGISFSGFRVAKKQ